jgi:hypothetical protein
MSTRRARSPACLTGVTARVEARSGMAWDEGVPFVGGRVLKRLARSG